ncbi:MAG: hypothetical protein QM516_09835, partial [Limnohabitans sp.]|nr:hypothetical protein [Limnohabitans sp.]
MAPNRAPMAEALPRIGWIEHSRDARGVRVAGRRDAVSPRVSAAELDRLAWLLDEAGKGLRGNVRGGPDPSPPSRLRYLCSRIKAAKSIAALLALAAATAVISQFATKSSHDLASNGSLAARGMPAAFDSSRSRGDGAMRGSVVTGVLSAGLFAGSALAQDAVQWRVEDGGNGHWYQVEVASGDFWQKQATATIRGGHLATVQSGSENSFIATLVAALAWPNEACSAYLGGYQDRNSADFSEPAGGW